MAVSPSHSAKKEASSPSRNSSITTSPPASPSPPPNIMSSASSASARRLRHDHAFAGGKSIGLDHDRRAARAQIGLGRRDRSEAFIGGGRDAVVAGQILGEAFGAFEPRRGLARAERLDAGRFEIVDDAGAERRFGSDHDEIDVLRRGRRRSPPRGRQCRAQRRWLRARCRHCPARNRACPSAGSPRSSRPAHVRGRRSQE